MRQSFIGAGMMFGGFLAGQVGPLAWRMYWVAVALLVLRFAWVLWRRLGLSRMACGLVLFAGSCVAISALGNNHREVSAAMDSHWVWFVLLFVAFLLLLLWERKRSPVELMLLGRHSESAGLRDRLTLRHIPDLRSQNVG